MAKPTVGHRRSLQYNPSPPEGPKSNLFSISVSSSKESSVFDLNVMCQRIQQRGFSLIELLIVVAIIGIVSAIAIPSLVGARAAAQEAAAVACLRTIHSSETTMKLSLGRYARMSELNQFHDGTLGIMAGPTLKRQGYTFQTIPTSPSDAQLKDSFRIAATGLGPDGVTPFIFLVDESGIISQLSP